VATIGEFNIIKYELMCCS